MLKLSYQGLADKNGWGEAGVLLPSYDPAALAERTKKEPVWVHFGIGNIFRIFIGGIADELIRGGYMDRGITCAETFDFDVVDRIYAPHDNLALAVTLYGDGRTDKRVLGCLTEALKANADMARLREIFTCGSLQMASFTITEKGYSLRGPDGKYLSYVAADIESGPEKASGAMAIVAALLYERWKNGGAPVAMVSMDNVSQNGKKLRDSVIEVARAWAERGRIDGSFLPYLEDESRVSFPWTMIDKITPRPSDDVAKALTASGIDGMSPIVTSKKTYIAPFVNAEAPQYLVIEDNFPNGRPPFEKAGVYMTGRETVNRSERMKVTVCLNPVHTALCTYDCLLGYEFFADGMKDAELAELARQVGYAEGLPVVEDPGIISPKAFLDEFIGERASNPYLGDTSARIAVDISQMLGIRFGHTIKAYVSRDGNAGSLTAIPLAIAGWLRYLIAVDDNGQPFELSPDPMLPELQRQMSGVEFGKPDSLGSHARPILSNANIFGLDLYSAGVGDKIEAMVREQLAGRGAVRAALKKYLWG